MRAWPATVLSFVFFCGAPAQQNDTVVCRRVFSFAFEQKLIDRPIGEVVVEVGRKFIGSPYDAHTLDRGDREQLVTDLRGFDCVTLIENSLALSRAVKRNTLTFGAYASELQTLRYRGGILDGYVSRLHYFTEWISDNERKGLLRNITVELGGRPADKELRFMTTHRASYAGLANDSVFGHMRAIEDSLTEKGFVVIPKKDIPAAEPKINTGDIVAFTTSVEGLDVSHTGIAVRNPDGSVRLLHAPDVGKTVTITELPISKYIDRIRGATGIIVCRPIEP